MNSRGESQFSGLIGKLFERRLWTASFLENSCRDEERMTRGETLLVFLVAALHFAVMARCAGANELMSDTKFGGSGLKQSRKISSAVGEAIGERKAIVSLDALYPDSSAGILLEQPFEEFGRREGAVLWGDGQEAQTREFINSSILKQAELWVCDTPARHHLHVHLNPLAEIGHLLIGFGFICFLLVGGNKPSLRITWDKLSGRRV